MAEENNAREIEPPEVNGKAELKCAPRKTIIGEIMMENFDHHELLDSARTRSASFSGDTRTGEAVRRHLKNKNMREEELDALIFEWLPERFVQSDVSLNNGTLDPAEDEDETSVTASLCWRTIGSVSRSLLKPIPVAAISGLILSATGVPLHPWLGSFIDCYGALFTPLMFGVMGAFLRLDSSQFSWDVGVALASRITISCMISVLILALPVDNYTKFTWTLSTWSPMTSFVIVLTFKFRFDQSRSVCASLLSQGISFVAMWVITIVASPN